MSCRTIIGRIARNAARAGAALLFFTASEASALDGVLVCQGMNSAQQPGTATAPVQRILSVFAFSNVNQTESIYINRIVIFDRDGQTLCDFSKDNPLPVMAFAPPEPFTFEKPLGPVQTLNVPTYALSCVPTWLNTSAGWRNIMGNLRMIVYWSASPKAKDVIPLLGGAATFVTDYTTGRIDSRDSTECKQIAP